MFLNDYSVRIVGGNEIPGGYVEMRHGQTFQISLRNNNNRRCDARVVVNGVNVGTWRLNAHFSATLERPADGDGKFTFYRVGTAEAYAVQPKGGDTHAGLIQVTFTPEEENPGTLMAAMPVASSSLDRSVPKGLSRYSAGVIGESGHSAQQYGTAQEIEYDFSGQTTISLRLICADDNGPRPLTQRATPVPPPIR